MSDRRSPHMLTPDERAEWRMAASGPSHGVNINSRTLLALLDTADERDRLAAATERVRELHSGNWVCGNPRHTNPEVDCPDCGVVCESCGDFHPCPTLNIVAEADHE